MAFNFKKNAKAIINCLYCCCFFVGFAKVVHADSFVVGVEDLRYYPYYDFHSEKPSFARTLLKQFATDNGHQITFLALPIKQVPKWLYQEKIDFKFPDNERWQKINNVHQLKIFYSDEVVAMRAGTLVLAKNINKDAATFKAIGTVRGFHPTHWLDKITQGKVALFEDASPTILVQYLVKGLVDGLIIDIVVAKNELQKLQLDEKIVYSNQIQQENYSYQLSTVKYPKILQQFNQWQIKRRKFIDELKAEYALLAVEP